MKTMYVYIVKCRDSSYYTGVTNDLERRLAEHNSGLDSSAYTYSRRPIHLVYCEPFDEPLQAIEHEKQIKSWTRKKKEALIERNWKQLKELSVCNNLTHYRYFKESSFDSAQDDNEPA